MKKGILGALLGFCALGMSAQNYGEIHGQVVDPHGLPLAGVVVAINNDRQAKMEVTDQDGEFKIKPLAAGTYKITWSMMTFKDKTMMGITVSPDRITFLDTVVMQEETTEIGPVVVEWFETPLINVDNPGMETISAKVFKHQPSVKNLNSYISMSVPTVTTNAEGTELYFRGSRGGTVLYYVDGVKVIGRTPQIPQSGIGSINIYTGGIPAKYGDVTGGVIVIETKNYFDIYNKRKYENN